MQCFIFAFLALWMLVVCGCALYSGILMIKGSSGLEPSSLPHGGDLSQEGGEKGDIVLRDLWVDSPDYDELTEKLHPKSEIGRVTNV